MIDGIFFQLIFFITQEGEKRKGKKRIGFSITVTLEFSTARLHEGHW